MIVEIIHIRGYELFLQSLVNRDIINDFKSGILKEGILSVEVELTDLLIPSIPCKKVSIKRTFNLNTQQENLSILIDGAENELTKDVGYDVFINDFILPREIAKFFFFDAEKIVSLAEAKSKDELRTLSKAYSEVLGIKKYEELKKNLETLLTKLRRSGVSDMNKSKLDSLVEKEKELLELIDLNTSKQINLDREITEKKRLSDEFQEKLIREGNAITVEQLKAFKEERDSLKLESINIKSKLNKLMELAPLVIAGKKLVELRDQLIKEQQELKNTLNGSDIKKEIETFTAVNVSISFLMSEPFKVFFNSCCSLINWSLNSTSFLPAITNGANSISLFSLDLILMDSSFKESLSSLNAFSCSTVMALPSLINFS